jgi:hypothetical protein
MTDWNQYARDVQAASNAAHNKDQKRIKELEDKLIRAVEFIQEVRRNGDTRLASMAIATLAKLEK